jgi:hypothetical protein
LLDAMNNTLRTSGAKLLKRDPGVANCAIEAAKRSD